MVGPGTVAFGAAPTTVTTDGPGRSRSPQATAGPGVAADLGIVATDGHHGATRQTMALTALTWVTPHTEG